MSTKTLQSEQQRRRRVRAKISGSAERPRLSIRISNRHITAQLIDDIAAKTLSYVSSTGQPAGKTMTDKAVWAGERIASMATQHNIKRVVFDRGGKIYHGRLDALAKAARDKGLEF